MRLTSFRVVVIAFTLIGVSTSAIAGPFGLTQGTSLSQLRVIKKLKNGVYQVAVPAPNAEFEAYHAVVTPQDGLCKIIAIGKDHDDDRSGGGARDAYDHIKTTLVGKYGRGQTMEFIRSEALWKSASEWVMSIKEHERTHDTFWMSGKEGAVLPADLQSLKLGMEATSSDSAYVTLGYEFQNSDRCVDRIRASNDSSL